MLDLSYRFGWEIAGCGGRPEADRSTPRKGSRELTLDNFGGRRRSQNEILKAAQAMGLTNGGLNTKLSAVVDARGRAVALCLAPGPQHDQHAVVPVLPSARGRRIVADKGFDADVFRARLRTQRTRCCTPPKRGRRQPACFHRSYYRCRHQIENFFGRIKIYRRISTRYNKLAETFLGFVCLAAMLDWLTH